MHVLPSLGGGKQLEVWQSVWQLVGVWLLLMGPHLSMGVPRVRWVGGFLGCNTVLDSGYVGDFSACGGVVVIVVVVYDGCNTSGTAASKTCCCLLDNA